MERSKDALSSSNRSLPERMTEASLGRYNEARISILIHCMMPRQFKPELIHAMIELLRYLFDSEDLVIDERSVMCMKACTMCSTPALCPASSRTTSAMLQAAIRRKQHAQSSARDADIY